MSYRTNKIFRKRHFIISIIILILNKIDYLIHNARRRHFTSKKSPTEKQAAVDAQQIKNSTNTLATTLNQQGAAQPLNKAKFSDVMTKLDDTPNAQLSAQELQQLTPMAVAASKALQNPQTANQMKQLITKSDTMDKAKELKVQQAQQQVGTNQPVGQQTPQSTNTPQAQQQTPGQTK